tara:strand:+ start:64 stop:531 length:468 start_codon:yes stop_codon:yes gene_type:complete
MKTSLGIRVEPNKISFSVVKENDDTIEIVLVDEIIVPKSLNVPEQLKFIRSTLSDIINENRITLGCIRIPESTAGSVNIPRTYIEGVIQELIASSSIQKYYVGQISSISSRLDIDKEDFKPLAKGDKTFMEMEIWSDINLQKRESLMASISALNI